MMGVGRSESKVLSKGESLACWNFYVIRRITEEIPQVSGWTQPFPIVTTTPSDTPPPIQWFFGNVNFTQMWRIEHVARTASSRITQWILFRRIRCSGWNARSVDNTADSYHYSFQPKQNSISCQPRSRENREKHTLAKAGFRPARTLHPPVLKGVMIHRHLKKQNAAFRQRTPYSHSLYP